MGKIMHPNKIRSWQEAEDAMGSKWRGGCKLDPHPFTLARVPTFGSVEASYSVRHHHDPRWEFVRYWPDGKIRLGNLHISLPHDAVCEAVNRFSPFVAELRDSLPPIIRWPGHDVAVNYRPGMLSAPGRGWIAPGQVVETLTREQRTALAKRSQEIVDRHSARVARQQMREAIDVDLFGHEEDDVS